MSHTPGPWNLAKSRSGETFGAIYSKTELVATTGYQVSVGSTEDEDNARLIAAAPDLAEACAVVSKALSLHDTGLPSATINVNDLQAMIAKLETALAKAGLS